MSDIKSNYADIGDGLVHYLTAGKGEPLVLLHGIPQTSYEWRYVIPMLSDRFRIVAPDLRGLGDSSRAANGFDKKTVAADVWKLVHDHLEIDTFFLVGHDWGGPTAFALTCAHQEAVKRLAILDVPIPGDSLDFSQNGRRWHHPFFRTPHLPEALLQDREHVYFDWLFDNYGYIPNSVSEADRQEYLRTYRKPGAMSAMFGYYRATAQDAQDNQAFLAANGKLRTPVLALGGDKAFGRGLDVLHSLQRVAENVRGGLVPNCGHWVTEEQPQFIANELRKFFLEDLQ
jgi:pimeloyl-ACP methyl ester carboxylesterase